MATSTLSAFVTRELPTEEWSRLVGTEAESVWQRFDPRATRIVVVECDGAIVASWAVMQIVHVECVWIAPSHRGAFSVVTRLLRGMRAVARQWGARAVVTSATTDDVRDLIGRLGGQRLPGEAYVLPVGEEGSCPRSS